MPSVSGRWLSIADVLSAFDTEQSRPGHTDASLRAAISNCCPSRGITFDTSTSPATMTVTYLNNGTPASNAFSVDLG